MLIDRYLVRLILTPFAATLLIFTCLLLLIRMAELLNYVIAEGGSFLTLARLLVFLVPQYFALALPVGLLTGVVLAFRGLALAGEWDALLAGGVSTGRLLLAPFLFSVAVAAAVFVIAGFLQPLSLYGYEKLRFHLQNGGDGVAVAAGEFKELGEGIVVRARESYSGGTDLRGVFISVKNVRGATVFTAERAVLAGGRVTLFEGRVIRFGEHLDGAAFSSYEIPIAMPPPPAFRARGNHERELLLTELFSADADAGDDAVMAGVARRLAQTAAVLALPMLGIALARPPRRGKGAEGLFVALGLFIIFNEVSLFGERLGFSDQAPPVMPQAAALGVFALVAVVLFARSIGRLGLRLPHLRPATR